MAEQHKLTAEVRDGTGKGVARKLRATGRVPGVLYGQGKDPIAMSVDSKELFHLLHGSGGNVLVDLTVAGKKHLAMPREIQRDHVRGQYLHIDFLEVSRSEKITVEVPIHLVGESAGVKLGGVLEHHLWDLKVECLPQDVPDAIEADISNLQVNDALRVEDITVPDACTVLTPVDETVAAVVPPQAREVAEAAEVVEGEVPAEEAEGATAAETVAEQTEG